MRDLDKKGNSIQDQSIEPYSNVKLPESHTLKESSETCESTLFEAHLVKELVSLPMSPENLMRYGHPLYQLPWKMPAEGPPSSDLEPEDNGKNWNKEDEASRPWDSSGQ